MPDDIRLSLCMIVKNEERSLGDCLTGIRPFVDEMVVVDTGSTDHTCDIARQFGARIFEFPWCDDFSAARNRSLEHARGQWLFWMDADDTIDQDNGRRLRQLADQTHDDATMGFVMQVHCPAREGDPVLTGTVVDHIKMFRNRDELRFEGRIHEQILTSIRRAGGEVEWADVFVVHSGHDYSAEGQRRKFERDLRLLELDLADRPDHPFVLFNLGMTYADTSDPEKAIHYLERCLNQSNPSESHVRKTFALLASSLMAAGRVADAAAITESGLRYYPHDAELLFRDALAAQHRGRLAQARHRYQAILDGPRPREFSSVDQGIYGFRTRQNLAGVYQQMGQLTDAERLWRSILDELPDYATAWCGLVDVLLAQGKFSEAAAVAETIVGRSAMAADGIVCRNRVRRAIGREAEAIADLRHAAEQHADSRVILEALCEALVASGRRDEARDALERLTARVPTNAAAWHNLGSVCLELGDASRACQALKCSIELRPHAAQTRLQLATALRQLDRIPEADDVLRELLREMPQDPAAETARALLKS